MDQKEGGQEENKEHSYVPSLTVHPQSILTQEGTNFFYSIHTQQKALEIKKRLNGKKNLNACKHKVPVK